MGMSLTDILLRDVNSERADSVRVEMGSRSVIRVPKSNSIVAYLVLEGHLVIETDHLSAPTVLQPGEYGVLLYGSPHCLYVDARRPSVRGVAMPQWPSGDEPGELKVGQGATKARFIGAALRVIHNPTRAHIENPVPDLFHLKQGAEHVFKDGALLSDVARIDAACGGPGANAFVNSLMNMHLTHSIRCAGMRLESAFQQLTSSPYLMSSEKTRAIAAAVRLLNTHPERNWTVGSVAKEVMQSRSTFAATFRSCVGSGPMEYLNKVRMERAAELLAEQRLELPLLTIAARIGYGAASSFARAFKVHYGISPRAFCKQSRGRPVLSANN